MKLSHKLIAGYVVIGIITVITGTIGIHTAKKLAGRYEQLALGNLPIQRALNELKIAGLRIVASTSEAVVLLGEKHQQSEHEWITLEDGDHQQLIGELKLIDEGKANFYRALGEYAVRAEKYDPNELSEIEPIERLTKALLEASFQLIVNKRMNLLGTEVTEAKEIFEQREAAYLQHIDTLLSIRNNELEKSLARNIAATDQALSLIVFFGSLALLVGFMFGILQARTIAANLSRLTQKAQQIGQGNLGQPVEVDTSDELAELATAFNKMTEDLKQTETERGLARTELEHYADQLEKNSRELQEVVYVASHDLQEPLRKVMTFCERLKYKNTDGTVPADPEYLNKLIATADRMRRLLDDLLEYSNLIRHTLVVEQIDLTIMVQRVSKGFHEMEGLEGEINYTSLPTIKGDPGLIRLLLFHLFDNAYKFSRNGVGIQVNVSADDSTPNFHTITIADNGRGFDQKYAERIFTIFEKLQNDTHSQGTGMGLALCRKIMEMHGGTIGVTSIEGAGAKFILNFPA
ncbi:MAG: HAMP domain-containing protein [Proteobacteria bacterium]|nr:HAMP domain-containing protein [Pseudomonadota bacterium]MBU1687600.1 HAMP domain-containing protein [Pseudomonadota bacterium]